MLSSSATSESSRNRLFTVRRIPPPRRRLCTLVGARTSLAPDCRAVGQRAHPALLCRPHRALTCGQSPLRTTSVGDPPPRKPSRTSSCLGELVSNLPSPPAARLRPPSWLDRRLVSGVLLVLTSMAMGARVLAQADSSVGVYAVTRDLAAGTTLTGDDLRVVRVRLNGNGDRYVSADGARPVGYLLLRAVGRDELLPRPAVRGQGGAASTRLVTLPVRRHHLPAALGHGDMVDIYLSSAVKDGVSPLPTLVLARVTVESVSDRNGSRLGAEDQTGVLLRVPVGKVPAVVAAGQLGGIDVVRVPDDVQLPPLSPPPASS